MKKSLGKNNCFFFHPHSNVKGKGNVACSKGVFIRYTSRILNVRKSAINCQNKTKFDMWQQSNSCPKAGQKNVTYVNDNYTLFLSSKRSF